MLEECQDILDVRKAKWHVRLWQWIRDLYYKTSNYDSKARNSVERAEGAGGRLSAAKRERMRLLLVA